MKKYFKKIIKIFTGGWRCPDCGGHNTHSSTYADWCDDCGYSYGY